MQIGQPRPHSPPPLYRLLPAQPAKEQESQHWQRLQAVPLQVSRCFGAIRSLPFVNAAYAQYFHFTAAIVQ